MPLESRVFVKTSLVALVLAFALPMVIAVNPVLLYGAWLVNLVIGVGLWLFPLNRELYPDTKGRFPRWLPWIVYVLLNGGFILRYPPLQLAGVLVFVALAWTRVK